MGHELVQSNRILSWACWIIYRLFLWATDTFKTTAVGVSATVTVVVNSIDDDEGCEMTICGTATNRSRPFGGRFLSLVFLVDRVFIISSSQLQNSLRRRKDKISQYYVASCVSFDY